MALRHWLQLALTEGIGPILSQRIVQAAGSAEKACGADVDLLNNIEGIGLARSRKFVRALAVAAEEVDIELVRAAAANVSILCPDESNYPLLLRDIPDPPNVLYVRGSVEDRDLNAVAVVGSRRCSYYGREQAERFGALLGGVGITVVSGGARGVDSAAHRGAIAHPHGRTIAVLGCGVDVAYPPENASLFSQIAERGAVMSEFPLGTPPNKENFPRRNRIVSGLSRGVLIIEADERSGALITARQACDDHGRPVFAIPGRVDNPLSAGPHALIRDGAVLVTKLDEILEALHPLPDGATQPTLFDVSSDSSGATLKQSNDPQSESNESGWPEHDDLSDIQRSILAEIGTEQVGVDLIIERSALPAPIVLQELTFLTLKGRVKRIDGQTFARTR